MFDLFWNVDTLYTINIRLTIILKLNTRRRTEVLFLHKQLINKKPGQTLDWLCDAGTELSLFPKSSWSMHL